MGPYYRHTSQGMGRLFEICYEHPALLLVVAACIIGGIVYFVRRNKQKDGY